MQKLLKMKNLKKRKTWKKEIIFK